MITCEHCSWFDFTCLLWNDLKLIPSLQSKKEAIQAKIKRIPIDTSRGERYPDDPACAQYEEESADVLWGR